MPISIPVLVDLRDLGAMNRKKFGPDTILAGCREGPSPESFRQDAPIAGRLRQSPPGRLGFNRTCSIAPGPKCLAHLVPQFEPTKRRTLIFSPVLAIAFQ